LYQPLLQIAESLSDTMALSGSEAFSSTLMFFSSIKNAMKSKIQKAKTIYNNLSAHFPAKARRENPAVGQ
jgi:hypothetical protein